MNTPQENLSEPVDMVSDLVDVTALPGRQLTARGERTRASLVAAARVVFERDGYLDARLTDITVEAKCSTGTFYTYFTGKEEIFAAVLAAAQEDMLHPGTARVSSDDEDDPTAIIEASNRAYFEAYKRNAKLMMLLEQVAMIDPKFRELRLARGQVFIERNARSIAELQAKGIADSDLDPLMSARALSGMVSRLAYHSFALRGDFAMDDLVATSTLLWVNALGINREKKST